MSLFIFILITALLGSDGGRALAQSHYFEGKTITILRGGRPGGSGDMQARSLILFLEK
jgi:hypothetical protein